MPNQFSKFVLYLSFSAEQADGSRVERVCEKGKDHCRRDEKGRSHGRHPGALRSKLSKTALNIYKGFTGWFFPLSQCPEKPSPVTNLNSLITLAAIFFSMLQLHLWTS